MEPTATNAARLSRALRAFGFASLADEIEELATPDRMITLGRPPLRIDAADRGEALMPLTHDAMPPVVVVPRQPIT